MAGANTPNEGADELNERILLSQVSTVNVNYNILGSVDGDVASLTSEVSVVKVIADTENNYFVCDNGDDSNEGVSPFLPFRTFEKGMSKFNSLPAGGSIYFCNGGNFPFVTAPLLFNRNCNIDNPCVISSYQAPNIISTAKPVISSLDGNTVFNFSEGGNADFDGGYYIKGLILKTDISKDFGIFVYNDVDDLTVDSLVIDGFRVGIYLAGTNDLNEGTDQYNKRFILRNSEIINNADQGFLGGCTDCSIVSNLFDNNGYAKRVFNHNIYLGLHGDSNILVANNILRKSAVIEGKCSGVSLVVHGEVKNLTIENNTIEEDIGGVEAGCWGIAVDPGYSREESFTNVLIKNNNIINVGNVAIGCSSCVNVLIENNNIYNGNDIGLSNIKIPSKMEDLVRSDQVVIRNNTMVNSNVGSQVVGVNITLESGEPLIEGNQLFYSHDLAVCQMINGEEIINEGACKKSN